MRLLLDEMYPAALAEQLRTRGHDVSAVTERPELRSQPDDDVFAAAQRERRAVVTENIGDCIGIVDGRDQRGESHYGLVLIDPVKYQRGRARTIGRLVIALAQVLERNPGDQQSSVRHWL